MPKNKFIFDICCGLFFLLYRRSLYIAHTKAYISTSVETH